MKPTPVTVPCYSCGKPCTANVYVDPGVRTFSNGDPGYPGSTDIDWTNTCEETYWDSGEESLIAPMEERALEEIDRLESEYWENMPKFDDE